MKHGTGKGIGTAEWPTRWWCRVSTRTMFTLDIDGPLHRSLAELHDMHRDPNGRQQSTAVDARRSVALRRPWSHVSWRSVWKLGTIERAKFSPRLTFHTTTKIVGARPSGPVPWVVVELLVHKHRIPDENIYCYR